jgi:hypothetical protein
MVLFILKLVFPIKAISNVFIFYELKLNSWLYNLNNYGHWPLHGDNIGSSQEEHCGNILLEGGSNVNIITQELWCKLH